MFDYKFVNPFRHVIGSKYAPHSPTLNSSFKEKLEFSYNVTKDMIFPVFIIPAIAIEAVIGFISLLATGYHKLSGLLQFVLFPAMVALALVELVLHIVHDYILKPLLVFTAEVAAALIAVAASPITLIVHGIASWIYNSMFKTARSLLDNKAEPKALGSYLDAYEKREGEPTNIIFYIIAKKSNTSTYQIVASLPNPNMQRFESKAIDVSDSADASAEQQQINAAARNLISLNYKGLAARYEEAVDGQKYSAKTGKY